MLCHRHGDQRRACGDSGTLSRAHRRALTGLSRRLQAGARGVAPGWGAPIMEGSYMAQRSPVQQGKGYYILERFYLVSDGSWLYLRHCLRTSLAKQLINGLTCATLSVNLREKSGCGAGISRSLLSRRGHLRRDEELLWGDPEPHAQFLRVRRLHQRIKLKGWWLPLGRGANDDDAASVSSAFTSALPSS